MAIRTQESASGFIANDPQLTRTENGDARFYARFGQENYRREENGSFTKLETSFHSLVMYRTSAERAYERFTKGDNFVAEGYVRTFQLERDGELIEREEFIAKKIGHDLARTEYEVDRTRHVSASPERAASNMRRVIAHRIAPTRSASAALGM